MLDVKRFCAVCALALCWGQSDCPVGRSPVGRMSDSCRPPPEWRWYDEGQAKQHTYQALRFIMVCAVAQKGSTVSSCKASTAANKSLPSCCPTHAGSDPEHYFLRPFFPPCDDGCCCDCGGPPPCCCGCCGCCCPPPCCCGCCCACCSKLSSSPARALMVRASVAELCGAQSSTTTLCGEA